MPDLERAISRIDFRVCLPDEEPACRLLAAMEQEMIDLYSIAGGVVGVPLELSEMSAPRGTYLVGWAGQDPVAGGGLRIVGPALGEIKRMYVVPSWRGRNVGRRLLAALEDAAREMSLQRLRLDTGPRQPEARHIYESAGYAPIGNYNGSEHASFWGQKRL